MTTLILYKAVAVINFAVFLYFGFDMRKRDHWRPMAQTWTTIGMKLSALTLATVVIAGVLNLEELRPSDMIALAIQVVGSILVTLAKIELVKHGAFTWTGYVLPNPRLVTSGVYSMLRHPLYTGVYLAELGAVLVIFPRLKEWFPQNEILATVVGTALLVYAVAFNASLAARESKYLRSVFGEHYDLYAQKVSAFIPKVRG